MLKSPKKREKKAVHGCALGNNLKSLSQHQKFFLTTSNPVQIIPTLVHCNTMYASDIVYLSDKKRNLLSSLHAHDKEPRCSFVGPG